MRVKRWAMGVLAIMLMILTLVGCGNKSPEDIVKSLEDRVEDLKSYSANGRLVLQTGQAPQEYDVEVWHKKPDYYRIQLTNREKSISQVILRNEEGVFVLTPHLNKSFRFQSGWPDRHGQVYLFESLVNSILDDKERSMLKENDAYVFHVKANYQNRNLVSQKIWFHQKGLRPQKVQVMDADYKVLVELTFNDFRFDVKFEDDAFEMDRNMTGSLIDALPTLSQVGSGEVMAVEPGYTPDGVYQTKMVEKELEDGVQYILQYDGKYQYTIIEEAMKEQMVIADHGEPVDLGFIVAALTKDGELGTLRFSHNGMDYRIITTNLPLEEMIEVAKSVYIQFDK
jgi:outer membrane lipoprotein-sorting protein